MITFNWCNECNGWAQFYKKGRDPREDLPWECTECEHETLKFPEYDNPIRWVLSGRRPKNEPK